MGKDEPKGQGSISFGDHGTFIVGGSGHGVGGHNDMPPGSSRWSRRGTVVVGVATVLGTVFGGGALWIGLADKSDGTGAKPPGRSIAEMTAPAVLTTGTDRQAAAPARLFDDVVTLREGTGVDVDGGTAQQVFRQETAADLFLADGTLFSSTRHGEMYKDTGNESGAFERCRAYLNNMDSRTSVYLFQEVQHCITTSDNRPAWVRMVRSPGDGTWTFKVLVWAR